MWLVDAATLMNNQTPSVLALWVKSRTWQRESRNPRGLRFLGLKPKFVQHKKPLRRLPKNPTGLNVGGPSGINYASNEKRYRWERVCNTAQMVGEDSDHDPNGCRVAMSALGIA
jgi:hypothetical protein